MITRSPALSRIVTLALLLVATRAAAGATPPGSLEGFGVTTVAGSAGDTLAVTHLRDAGPGSLRAALEARGPRVVVFEVGGLISLRSRLLVAEPFLTVLGQTAPSPGITIRHHDMSIRTHDVLIQHIRIRVGDRGVHKQPGTVDGIQVIGAEAYNVVVDHCSISWTIDECVSIRGPDAHDITFSNCIFAEALNQSIHPKGPHAFGPMITEHTKRVAFVKNLLAHFSGRNFDVKGDTETLIVNNVIYDPVWIFIGVNNKGRHAPPVASIVGNVCLKGPSARGHLDRAVHVYATGPETTLHVSDNVCEGCEQSQVALADSIPSIRMVQDSPVPCEHLTILPGSHTLDYVLANAGARPWNRDRTDNRIVAQVRERSGRIIDSQADVGGWEEE